MSQKHLHSYSFTNQTISKKGKSVKNIIVFVANRRNFDGSLLLHYLCIQHLNCNINLSLIVVVGQPILKRANDAYNILKSYNLHNQIQITLGSPNTNTILFCDGHDLDTDQEYESAYPVINRMLNPFKKVDYKYSIIAASGLEEIRTFLQNQLEQCLDMVEEVVLLSGVKAVSNEQQSTSLDNSTNNLKLGASDELGLLALLQPVKVLEEKQIKIKLISKHLPYSFKFNTSKFFDSLELKTGDVDLVKNSLQLLYLLSSFRADHVARRDILPTAFNDSIFWSMFREDKAAQEISPLEKVWDHIDFIYFYDVFCAIVLINPEWFDPKEFFIVDPYTNQKSKVEVYGLPMENPSSENIIISNCILDKTAIESELRTLLASI